MKEVEILVRVLEPRSSAQAKLRRVARFVGRTPYFDTYYLDPLRKRAFVSRDGTFRKILRLRRKGKDSYLAFKKDVFDPHGSWLYSEENETRVAKFQDTKEIVDALGLVPLVEVKMDKWEYRTGEYIVTLERVRGLGLLLEVEAPPRDSKERILATRARIRRFIQRMGIRCSKELESGKPELILRRAPRGEEAKRKSA